MIYKIFYASKFVWIGSRAISEAVFGYDNSVSLQTDDAGHVGAAVLAHVACVVGLQTNDVRRS